MKTTFLKPLFFLVFSISSTLYCFGTPLEDTTTKKLLASAKKINSNEAVLKASNVVFPSIFLGDENQYVSYVEKFSENRRAYLLRTYKRSLKFFPKAVAILKQHNIPAEFAVLLALESGFNGNAVSSAGAVGYWQIMDEVAKEYGLKIAQKEKVVVSKKGSKKDLSKTKAAPKKKSIIDERKNFVKSTYAAAKYLRDRHRNLNGDWLLITASYNCGVGNVWEAMEKCGKKNPDFWDIKNYLPAETRAYVMNFIALNVIFKNYEKFAGNELCFKDIMAKRENITQ